MSEPAIELPDTPIHLTRPELPMEPDAIAEALRLLQNGQRVIVWYRPIGDFDVHSGVFSIAGSDLEGDEVDFVVKGIPMIAEVHDALDEGEAWDDDDAASGTFHDLETSVDIAFHSDYVDAYWAIQPDSGYGDAISRVDVATSRFTFNAINKTVTLDREEVDLAELEVLHVKIGQHLNNL